MRISGRKCAVSGWSGDEGRRISEAEVVFPSIISAQFVSPGAKLGTILDGAQKYAMILGAAAAPSTPSTGWQNRTETINLLQCEAEMFVTEIEEVQGERQARSAATLSRSSFSSAVLAPHTHRNKVIGAQIGQQSGGKIKGINSRTAMEGSRIRIKLRAAQSSNS